MSDETVSYDRTDVVRIAPVFWVDPDKNRLCEWELRNVHESDRHVLF
jgi:hypothetical protein